MHRDAKNILLIAMPFAEASIPSIQLALLKAYLKERDIPVQTKHLYLKASEIYGFYNYYKLNNPPSDSYTAQIGFIKHVFPNHWKKKQNECRQFFNAHISGCDKDPKQLSFDDFIEKTDIFYDWMIQNVDWKPYDIIGFTLNYGQLLPSLALAKKIKEENPDKMIVLGGSRAVEKPGAGLLKAFTYIDYIVSGDGEEALYLLASDSTKYRNIERLIYRENSDVTLNQSNTCIDLDALPFPSFDSYYEELATTADEVQQYHALNGRLPVEISRGCWWNRCTFCNINVYHQKYREKSVDRLIDEIIFLSDKYKMVQFQLIGDTLLKDNYRLLFDKLINLERDFTFYVEARAGKLTSSDYTLMKEAGFSFIQTGIETFSPHYLKKMNKGTRIIDNIAALKFCKENNIKNVYNIIINYPNEELIDFEETRANIRFFQQYLDPPQLSHFIIEYGSPIYMHPDTFNIKTIEYTNMDKLLFPEEILAKDISFYYTFIRKKECERNDWNALVDNWKKVRRKFQTEAIEKQGAVHHHVFYFVDCGNFVKIYDKRAGEQVGIYVLNEMEREVFLSCLDITTYQQIRETLSHIPEFRLSAILNTFEQMGIVFKEEDSYLSLPLQCNPCRHYRSKEEQAYENNSGIQRNLCTS